MGRQTRSPRILNLLRGQLNRRVDRLVASAFRVLPPEAAHELALRSLERIPAGPVSRMQHPRLQLQVFGIDFLNPVGLAAGFDKDARAIRAFQRLGWGFVEIGGVTPRPQPGNPKPRLFRLPGRAMVNRLGFNSQGMIKVGPRLRKRPRGLPVFANLGANQNTADPADDWEVLLKNLYDLADGFTLNISSPNTPSLLSLHQPDALDRGLKRVLSTRKDLAEFRQSPPAPMLVKISPDLDENTIAEIAEVCHERGVDGIIATNTSSRLRSRMAVARAAEAGGLSGPPLHGLALRTLRRLHSVLRGSLPLIGVGGIGNAQDAYERIRAGASLVQIYTAMIWEGPGIGTHVARELAFLLARDGFDSVADAVGVDADG